METISKNRVTSKPPEPLAATPNRAEFKAKPFYDLAKRATETAIALLILIGLSPVWLLVALAIKLSSPGPVFFKGRVVGRNGKEFTYYKFRSMRHNSDNSEHRKFIQNYVQQGMKAMTATSGATSGTASGATSGTEPATSGAAADEAAAKPKPQFKLTNDKRITWIGKIIRKLSVDEVPQLINVVRGEMGIVGPRPPVPYEYSLYDDYCKQRLNVLPGITGLAQVRMRGTASFRQMVELDLEYIENRSYRSDWQIMLKTPLAMLKGA